MGFPKAPVGWLTFLDQFTLHIDQFIAPFPSPHSRVLSLNVRGIEVKRIYSVTIISRKLIQINRRRSLTI